MSETESLDRIIASLKKVSAKRLLIIELVNKVCSEDGELDHDELERIKPEVNLAIAEAKMYGAHTMVAVDTLKRLPARKKNVGDCLGDDLILFGLE